MNFKEMFGKAGKFANEKSPEILTGLALVGLVTTLVTAYRAGIAAEPILKKRQEDLKIVKKDDKEAKKAVNMECAKKLAPKLAAPIIIGTATGACILGSHTISARRAAVLSAAYSVAEKSLKDLNLKMRETLGESKTQQIKDSISKDNLKKMGPVSNVPQEFIYNTGKGTVLCKDRHSGRLFYSDAEHIRQAVNKLSYDIITDMWISLNDFYSEINLEQIPLGDDLGWDIDDTDRGKLPITVTAILTEDDRPCLCVDYDVWVRPNLRDLK